MEYTYVAFYKDGYEIIESDDCCDAIIIHHALEIGIISQYGELLGVALFDKNFEVIRQILINFID